MQKSTILIPFALMLGMTATARSLSPAEALNRLPDGNVAVSRSASGPRPVMTVGTADAPTLYVFNKSGNGWMIVSADDVAAPLIGYSDTGVFDPENLPENFRSWLEEYSDQISRASEIGSASYTTSRATDRDPIPPLMATRWDQRSPYNNLCPTGCPTGCVATAMAQVMKYYNWPETAAENANLSYTWGEKTYSHDYSNFPFDWANMLDSYKGSYTPEQGTAVAELMRACGYSVEMQYNSYASGAVNQYVGMALAKYFKYDSSLHNEPRNLYNADEWEELIYNNLRDFGPTVYWGSGEVGHCFVCDGYSHDGYFHFNWGWSGLSDGYFLLDALDPDNQGTGGGAGGFNGAQGALLGVKPLKGEDSERRYTLVCSVMKEVKALGTFLTIEGEFKNYSSYIINGQPIYRIYSEDGKKLITTTESFTKPSKYTNFEPGSTQYGLQGSISKSVLGEGTYRIVPGIRIDGKDYEYKSIPSVPSYILYTRTKNGGNYTNTAIMPEVGEKVIENFSTNGDFFKESPYKVSGIAKFTGNADAELQVYVVMLDKEGNVIVRGATGNLTFTPEGQYFEITSQLWFQDWDPNNDYEPIIPLGENTCALAYVDAGTAEFKILASCPVTVNKQVMNSDFKFNSLSVDASNPNEIKLDASVEGLAGISYTDIYFEIWTVDGKTKIWGEQRAPLYASAGQTVAINVTASLPNAQKGEQYKAYVFRKRYGQPVYSFDPVIFTIGESSGIAGIEADDNAAVEYFNLQGMRVDAENLTPGVYIRRQGAKVSKIIVK